MDLKNILILKIVSGAILTDQLYNTCIYFTLSDQDCEEDTEVSVSILRNDSVTDCSKCRLNPEDEL